MIGALIEFTVSNFTLSFLAIGIVVALVAIARAAKPVSAAVVVEKFMVWYLFFATGAAYAFNGILHCFFGKQAAAFIGWADSPFQLEVGTASLGFAAAAFVAAFGSLGMRLVAIIGPSVFTLGAAVGHVRQMIVAHNFAPGNAGVIFWTDIIIPLIGAVLLLLQWRLGKPVRP